MTFHVTKQGERLQKVSDCYLHHIHSSPRYDIHKPKHSHHSNTAYCNYITYTSKTWNKKH